MSIIDIGKGWIQFKEIKIKFKNGKKERFYQYNAKIKYYNPEDPENWEYHIVIGEFPTQFFREIYYERGQAVLQILDRNKWSTEIKIFPYHRISKIRIRLD